MKIRNKYSEFLNENKSVTILIITVISLGFNLLKFNFDLLKSIMGVITLLVFSSFIAFMYHQYLKLYKESYFFYWWWRLYLIMLILSLLSWLSFG